MLVLSRKKDESVVIGGADGQPPIVVTVTRISGDNVRLGIDAPREINVRRAELPERTRDQNTEAA
jgi:carbon storage regulator